MTTANIKMASVLILFALLSVFLTVAEAEASQQFLLRNGAKIEDTKTGLEWAINAGTPSLGKCNGGKKTWDEAADYVNCLNSSAYLGHNDWRIPSVKELSRLISTIAKVNKIAHKYDITKPKLKKLKFKNIQPSLY